MSTPILLNVPSATQSFILDCKAGMDLALAKGYAGVRFSAGLSGYGNNPTVTTTYVSQAVAYAHSLGLTSAILLNLGPNPSGNTIKTLNGGNPLPVPHLPTATAVLDWVATAWQAFVDAARLQAPDNELEWEWLNEGDRGGNQTPIDSNNTYTTYSTLLSGEYPVQTSTSLEYVSSRVNFHASNTICFTLEGSGTTEAQREVDSIVGGSWASVINRATHIGTNRYGDAPATPYSSAAVKLAFHTKLGSQLDRMAANPLIGAKPVKLREFGLDAQRKPPCQFVNTVRNDILQQVKTEVGIVDGAFFCAYDVTGNIGQGQAYWFYAYNRDTTTPLDGVDVKP